ncbi:catalase [Dongia soli]|uniref:Catalase n=1 Tax=Dongia soli TaxID=600628 RepID=A0ABU5E7E9_9PROT|nr:catalase [Dongia soli]MDY0881634.1 catalase [Dongia soli]
MAKDPGKSKEPKSSGKRSVPPIPSRTGHGGELHQTAAGNIHGRLTTNQGVVISDNQNSLRLGERGTALLEDFILREKIAHFDHERIPERIVYARGSAAHGYFQVYKSLSAITRAAFLQNPQERTRVFVRFSTLTGGAGSIDTPRDLRGFAVKFYTSEGNFDLVGSNIPVFFIQDAMKFPDLAHALKMEPDRGFPQAASAHDTFWDFVSLTPESMHMLMWVMSDRAIPRSFRMMEGFGVHTFRLINACDEAKFVKFHWRPTIGSTSLIWDEAVKLGGADPDFHRRDLWEAIDKEHYPEFELGLQVFDEAFAEKLDFDILDPTKLISEELLPLQMVGKLVLDRNPDNFFAETEQVAFHPGHVVPGIDFTNDPLLQGRLCSYLDAQLIRLGGPNFHEIPINRPVCPWRNFQRDGQMRMTVAPGQIAYEPNSIARDTPRECPETGFQSYRANYPVESSTEKRRSRAESFADHYSQARLFWTSMTPPEQQHIVSAFSFELGKVARPAIRQRMLGHLMTIHSELGRRVIAALGVEEVEPAKPAVQPRNDKPSPALSIVAKAPKTIQGRKIAILVTDGSDAAFIGKLKRQITGAGAEVAVLAPLIGGIRTSDGNRLAADHALYAGPSVFFDAVAILPSSEGVVNLAREAAAIDWLRDAFAHLKVIAYHTDAALLFEKAQIDVAADEGMVVLNGSTGGVGTFLDMAKQHRIWAREPLVRGATASK